MATPKVAPAAARDAAANKEPGSTTPVKKDPKQIRAERIFAVKKFFHFLHLGFITSTMAALDFDDIVLLGALGLGAVAVAAFPAGVSHGAVAAAGVPERLGASLWPLALRAGRGGWGDGGAAGAEAGRRLARLAPAEGAGIAPGRRRPHAGTGQHQRPDRDCRSARADPQAGGDRRRGGPLIHLARHPLVAAPRARG